MEQKRRNQEKMDQCPTRMTINTFTHDYYLLQLPENQQDSFYRLFSFYSDILDYRGNHIPMAPVARIYGTNQFGQKCCCHVHGYFPHFYIKAEEYSHAMKTDPDFLKSFLMVLENLYQRAYNINKPIIVYGETQQKVDFYGYHENPQTFLKITLYNPLYVTKMRQLLDSQILGRSFQCYEAHINFFMQLFSERNIFGINEMNICDFTFRKNMSQDVMDLFKKIDFQQKKLSSSGHNVIELEKKYPNVFNNLHKLSSCFIEVDFHVDNILNSFDDNYDLEENENDADSSMDIEGQDLGEGRKKFQVKITRALQEIWIDEKKRRNNFGISVKPKGIIDFSKNIEGRYSTQEKNPLYINFLKKGSNKEQFIQMLRSSERQKPLQQTNELVINRDVAENYNDVLASERQKLIQRVEDRWKYYGARKMKIISQMMSGERGQLPEWKQKEQQIDEIPSEEDGSGDSDKDSQSNQQLELKSNLSPKQKVPGNTILYRNNYKHTRPSLKKQSFFNICEYCRKMARQCLCSLNEDSQIAETQIKQLKKAAVKKRKKYMVPAPSYEQVMGDSPIEQQKPYYSNLIDLFGYHRVNNIFPICLKTAQLLDRELKIIRDLNRDPITIKNELKLPDYYRYSINSQRFQKDPSSKFIPKSYRLKYEPKPPSFQQINQHIIEEAQSKTSRFKRSTSLKPMKQDTFVSDLLVFHYEFILRFDTKKQHKYYGNPEDNQIICFSYTISNFKDYNKIIRGLIVVEQFVGKQKIEIEEYEDVFIVKEQRSLLTLIINIIFRLDPDILITFDQQKKGIRYLTQRGFSHSIAFQDLISRTCQLEDLFQFINFRDFSIIKANFITREILLSGNLLQKYSKGKKKPPQLVFLEQKMKQRLKKKPVLRKKYHFDVQVKGRVNLNIYRVCEAQLKLKSYSIEAVAKHLFGQQICQFTDYELFALFSSKPNMFRNKKQQYGKISGINYVLDYLKKRIQLQAKIIVNLNIISVVIEKSKIFGADFISMMERGSQFKIESVMCRVTKKSGYLTLSASKKQVANQSVLQCRPLVIEPPKQFFPEPVLLFDFQSLYPSVMIAYNICYSTCLGSIHNIFNKQKKKRLGVSQSMNLDLQFLENLMKTCEPQQFEKALQNYIFITPNKVAFVKKNVRQGLIPRILLQFLISRIMIKDSMGLYQKSKIKKLLKDRQYALKIFMNVMFGYTGASFSGRMPCSQIADSVVEVAKYSLRIVIDYLNEHPKYKGKVLYGDTDSVFFQMPGYSISQALQIGKQLAKQMTGLFPYPMEMKFQKVYDGLFLVAKKRYYGKSYEPGSSVPKFEGKGLECVRRDGIPFTSNLMGTMLNILIESRDLSELKKFFKNQCCQILGNQKIECEFSLAKQVKLLKYSQKSIPGHGVAAKRLQKIDPMLVPKYGERMKYLIVNGGLKPLKNRSIPVFQYMLNNRMSLDLDYYLKKQVIPPMQRVLCSLANLDEWAASLEITQTEQTKNHSQIQLNKKCLRCKGQTYFVLCEKCMSFTSEQIKKLDQKKKECMSICEECIGHGNPASESKCVQWNCENLWMKKKIIKCYDGVYPELMKLKEAMKQLNF